MCFFLMIRRPPRSTLSLHDALPISLRPLPAGRRVHGGLRRGGDGGVVPASARQHVIPAGGAADGAVRLGEHTSELQARPYLVCRLLLDKKKTTLTAIPISLLALPLL